MDPPELPARYAQPRQPKTRVGPFAPDMALPAPALVSQTAVPAAAGAKLYALAHVHSLWLRRRDSPRW